MSNQTQAEYDNELRYYEEAQDNANSSCFECEKLTRCPCPSRGMPDDGSTPPCFKARAAIERKETK